MPAVDQNSVLEAAMAILFRGGWVLAPIFVLGWFGWFLMLERYAYYFMLRGGTVNGVVGMDIFMRLPAMSAITATRGQQLFAMPWKKLATAYR